MTKIIKIFIFSAFVSTSVLPVLVAAQAIPTSPVRNEASNGTSTGKGSEAVCSNLATRAAESLDRFPSRLDELKSKETAREARRLEQWNKHLANLDQKRAEQDARIAAHTVKLNDKAQSDDQRQAVVVFQSAVQAAIQARRTAVDAALDAFRKGIADALAARKSGVEKALDDFTVAFKAAASKAEVDCASGIAPRTVRTTFTSAVKTTRASLTAARKAGNNFGETMKQLTAAKKVALDKAQGDFKAALEKAKVDLKAAIGSQKPTSTTP